MNNSFASITMKMLRSFSAEQASFRRTVYFALLLLVCGCDTFQEEGGACTVKDRILINQIVEVGRRGTRISMRTDRGPDSHPTVHVTRDGDYRGEYYIPMKVDDGLSLTFTTKTVNEIDMNGQMRLVTKVVIRLEACDGWEIR